MGLVDIEEIVTIQLQVCKFQLQTTVFYVQNASLFSKYMIK